MRASGNQRAKRRDDGDGEVAYEGRTFKGGAVVAVVVRVTGMPDDEIVFRVTAHVTSQKPGVAPLPHPRTTPTMVQDRGAIRRERFF